MGKETTRFPVLQSKGAPVYVGSQVVGQVSGDIFSKTVVASKHFLRQPAAIAFDLSAIEQAVKLGASKIIVYDRESGTVYQCSIEHIRRKGFTFNRGHGDQIGLVLADWTKQGHSLPVQSSLFS